MKNFVFVRFFWFFNFWRIFFCPLPPAKFDFKKNRPLPPAKFYSRQLNISVFPNVLIFHAENFKSNCRKAHLHNFIFLIFFFKSKCRKAHLHLQAKSCRLARIPYCGFQSCPGGNIIRAALGKVVLTLKLYKKISTKKSLVSVSRYL